MSISRRSVPRTAAAVTALLWLTPSSALLAAPVPAPLNTSASKPATLKHLPAGHDELVFRGETAKRNWSVYLGRGDIEATKTFQFAFKNTVALLPDTSSVTLRINGQTLASVPATSSNGFTTLSEPIPPGLLVPGFNTVEIAVAMTHRVDCSVAATYELWTAVDPARTGFVVKNAALNVIQSLDDVAGATLAEDGTIHIALRAAEGADAAAIGRAGRFVSALVSRTGLARPVVDAGFGVPGTGFDIVIAKAHDGEDALRGLRILGREDGITFARDPASDRSVLVLSGVDDADLDRQIEAFAAKAPRVVAPATAGLAAITGETRTTFAALGLKTDNFSGRHYTSALDVELPSDFYSANYDKARLSIDGSYAANLDPDSNLVFRVNGILVSSLRLGPDRGGVLQHELVELPLRFFHPGHNDIGIEGVTSTPSDRQCDTASMPHDVRFSLSGTSEIAFPRFAHLATVPQIPGAVSSKRGTAADSHVNLYLPDASPSSIGSGLTVLANMATTRHDRVNPTVHVGQPLADDVPGIIVAPYDALPGTLSARVATQVAVPDPAQPTASMNEDGLKGSFAVNDSRGRIAFLPDDADAYETRSGFDPRKLIGQARSILKNQGFFFGAGSRGETVPFTAHSLLLTAIDPRPKDQVVAGMEVPRFTSSVSQWLVVTAADAATLRQGLTRLVSDGQWSGLDGQSDSLDLENGRITSVQPSRVLYVIPKHIVLSDLRPILGGIVSNHIELSLAALMLLMAMLGVSTHTLIRRAGVK